MKVHSKYPIDVVVHDEVYNDVSDDELMESFTERYDDWHIKVNEAKLKAFLKSANELKEKNLGKKRKNK